MRKKQRVIENENAPKKVGKVYDNPDRPFSYKGVDFDSKKWADADKFLPGDFDLLWLQIEDLEKPITGWYTGTGWDGHRVEPYHKVLKWRMNYDH